MPTWREGIHLEDMTARQSLIVYSLPSRNWSQILPKIACYTSAKKLHMSMLMYWKHHEWIKHYSIWRTNSQPLSLIENFWKKLQRSLQPGLLDGVLSTTIRYTSLRYSSNRDRLTKSWSHILIGLFSPRSCVEAYNSCKSHGAESSRDWLTYRSSVAIRPNGRPLSLSFASKGCCSAS